MDSLLLLLIAVPPLGGPSSGQQVGGAWEELHHVVGIAAYNELGHSVAGAGDLDGDGRADVVVGEPYLDVPGAVNTGAVRAFSGATGLQLWERVGPADFSALGKSVATVGDLDGDGLREVVAGAPDASSSGVALAGAVLLLSGSDGAVLRQFDGLAAGDSFGVSVANAGDVDADGVPDVLVGAPHADPGAVALAGSAFVYSGAGGTLLARHDGTAHSMKLGWTVAGLGDVDGDGFGDYAVGASASSVGGIASSGRIHVYSGRTHALIRTHSGSQPLDHFGSSITGPGDVDGDGLADVFVGARGTSPQAVSRAGSAYLYSGGDGSLLLQLDGTEWGGEFGSAVAGAGDVDADGVPDLLVGEPLSSPSGNYAAGAAYVYSGGTGTRLHVIEGDAFDNLGKSVDSAGDVDGDRLPDLILGAPAAVGTGGAFRAGAFRIWSLDPFLHLSSGTLSLTGSAPVRLGLRFPAPEAGRPFAILASLAGVGPVPVGGVSVPLGLDPLLLRMASGWTPAALENGRGHLDGSAQALARLHPHPSLVGLLGSTVYLSAVTMDSSPAAIREVSIVRRIQVVP